MEPVYDKTPPDVFTRAHLAKRAALEPECGVTEISLANAKQLIQQHGLPARLDFKADKTKCDYFVVASWPDQFSFVFEGFAWGYEGTGPNGLTQFFILAQVDSMNRDNIPLDRFGKTDCSWFRIIDFTTPIINHL